MQHLELGRLLILVRAMCIHTVRAFLFEPLYVVRHAGGNPLNAVVMGMQETASFAVLTYLTIDRLFRGTVKVEHLQGRVELEGIRQCRRPGSANFVICVATQTRISNM